MTNFDYLTHEVRAWTEQTVSTHKSDSNRVIPDSFLVFDTETTTDQTQHLTFGTFFYGCYVDGKCEPCGEGIFYADDLLETDPEGYRILQEHARVHPIARVDSEFVGTRTVDQQLIFISRTEFLERYFYAMGMTTIRNKDVQPAAIVGFNLPFDISRIAEKVVQPRGEYRNGFSFEMLPHEWLPNVRTTRMGAKGRKFEFTGRYENDPRYSNKPRGVFIDTHTLVYALTGSPMSLDGACRRFKVDNPKDKAEKHGVITDDYIWYARNDARATMQLYEAVSNELYSHGINLPADRVYSPAAIAKAYFAAMGIGRPLVQNQGFPHEVLGYATTGFYGGRSEVMVRRVPVPVSLYDFTSMYPTVSALLGMWALLTSKNIRWHDETSQVQDLLNSVTLDKVFDPEAWRGFVGFARVKLHGDVVPIRAQYGDDVGSTIGLNHGYSDSDMWYAIPDLVASALITGKAPTIDLAYRLYPSKVTQKLSVVDIRGVRFDPHGSDFFVYCVEKRNELKEQHKKVCEEFRNDKPCDHGERNLIEVLKVIANSGCYGVFVEMNRENGSKSSQETVHGITSDPWTTAVERPEKAGKYCFPPIGVVIPSATRLMLAMLERCVTDAGGVWAFCDTDSMCIVSSPSGAPVLDYEGRAIPVLTYDVVEGIKERFEKLNPYDPAKVSDLLKREQPKSLDGPQLYAYAISSKRYTLYRETDTSVDIVELPKKLIEEDTIKASREDAVDISKRTEHGLGAYLDPRDPDLVEVKGKRRWVDEVWKYLIRKEQWDHSPHGDDDEGPPRPDWVERPALVKKAISTWNVYAALSGWNGGKPYRDQVKPFNFHLVAPNARDYNGKVKLSLIAPYNPVAAQWESIRWCNLKNSTDDLYEMVDPYEPVDVYPGKNYAELYTYRDLIMRYQIHPELKYLGPDGKPCSYSTTGLLQRRHVNLSNPDYIGKEANNLEEREVGLVDRSSALNRYNDNSERFAELVAPVLIRYASRDIVSTLGGTVSQSTVSRALAGQSVKAKVKDSLIRLAVDTALEDLG